MSRTAETTPRVTAAKGVPLVTMETLWLARRQTVRNVHVR